MKTVRITDPAQVDPFPVYLCQVPHAVKIQRIAPRLFIVLYRPPPIRPVPVLHAVHGSITYFKPVVKGGFLQPLKSKN
jgi:hypothetical protein